MSRARPPARGCIVLCGGGARRMNGRCKSLLLLGGRPLAGWAVAAAEPLVDELVLCCRTRHAARRARAALPGVFALADPPGPGGPLAGIASGLARLSAPLVLVVGGDMPLVGTPSLARLLSEAEGSDAAVPRHPDGALEPLCAAYQREAMLAAARSALADNRSSVLDAIARLESVRFIDLGPGDPLLVELADVDTPADLERVGHLVAVRRSPLGF